MFASVLIANRAEIAVRIIRTLRAMGVRSVAVHSDADRDARHVREADLAVRLDRGYLDIDAVIEAARATGAEAIHPGYGFLAENAEFARRCAAAGLVFVGPPAEAIEAMGDKIRAKETVSRAGVPVVPGGAEPDDDLVAAAAAIGFPVLVKPSAGGGGKGMLPVWSAGELPAALESARRTALAAFGDGTLLIERLVERPRHIEIQVLADGHGNVVHLGERECSLQRRHQKIIEEAPSPLLDADTRERMGAAAVDAAKSVGYVGAGTVEFIVSGRREHSGAPIGFSFMEMNTRLQVEHPVTEMVTGLDLVELQLRIAAGEPLPFGQEDVRLRGHAVEARVYAEDPARDFLPTGGRILALREPAGTGIRVGGAYGDGVRVDSGLAEGMAVGSDYDPMLAKVVAWAPDRAGALAALDRALGSTVLLGVTTNVAFLRGLLADPGVTAGTLDTGLVERHTAERHTTEAAVPDEVLAAAALVFQAGTGHPAGDPWDVADGWRIGERAWTLHRLGVPVRVRGPVDDAEIEVNGRSLGRARLVLRDGEAAVTVGGVTRRYALARDHGALWLGALWHEEGGHAWRITRAEPGRDREATAHAGDGVVRSPMPGTVLVVKAAEGDPVTAGQPLLIVEAMKMEHTLTAPVDGVLAELRARPGQSVELDAILARVTACE
ncbi:acetyl/propionyl/methylcrotonyl-CoA carboxylase subunit alpha [Sphaerimonospora thailandensis]|uniref:Biotin-dependent 3-methylcrotonyl-coenzyme A carboxylase alpha1 subunit n=1 Tax=Sphaerimonospora thailandensis TaxID=795644 RepID=A0A8J3RGV6_9ACTN|nr:biotin carboxylase N-terminal domain-containing protein [Sphaerimonospora thailandensis]GIH72118.1 acetyl/propionyl-CoA carboxylase subuit alpha [Sphaerimonospora thailandensis]